MTPQEREARGPAVGRPRLPPEEKLHSYSIRLTHAERDKLQRVGGRAAVRAWLDTLPDPKPKRRTRTQ